MMVVMVVKKKRMEAHKTVAAPTEIKTQLFCITILSK